MQNDEQRKSQKTRDAVHQTRPAMVCKVTSVDPQNRLTVVTPDGREIRQVMSYGRFKYFENMFVTVNFRNGSYFVLQVAPHGFE